MFWELFEIFLVIQLVVAIDPTSNIFFVIAQKNSILTLGDWKFLVAFDCQSM